MLAAWPDATNSDDQDLAVNNVLNNLLGDLDRACDAWSHYISVQPAEVASVLARWRGDDKLDRDARGYFDRLR